MTQHDANREPWDACPAGELGQMVARDRHRRRNQALGKLAGVGVVAVLLVAGGLLIANRAPKELFAGNLWCSDVLQHVAGYHRGELDADLTQQMRTHLAACPECRDRYRQMLEATGDAARNGHTERLGFLAWSLRQPASARR